MVSFCKFYLVVTPLPGTKKTTHCRGEGAFGLSKDRPYNVIMLSPDDVSNGLVFSFNTTLSVETENKKIRYKVVK